MQDGLFIIGKEKLEPGKDPTDAIYLQMILTRMASKNQLRIQSNPKTKNIAEKIIATITNATGWFIHEKQELNNGACRIMEYTIRRPPAIELKQEMGI